MPILTEPFLATPELQDSFRVAVMIILRRMKLSLNPTCRHSLQAIWADRVDGAANVVAARVNAGLLGDFSSKRLASKLRRG